MISPLTFHHYLGYFLKRDVTKLYVSIAIRNFAIGTVLIFEPIYLYMYFGESLPLALLFFGIVYGFYGLTAFFGGKILSILGTTRSILLSSFFYTGYYISLFLLDISPLFLITALLCSAIGMLLFWPAFNVDFTRFSSQHERGKDVGKVNVASFFPTILSPLVGGWILSVFGYPVLFLVAFLLLLASTIPLFYSREHHEVYTDNHKKLWSRITKKQNRGMTIAIASNGIELVAYFFLWPLFLFLLALDFLQIGEIVAIALAASAFFMLYIGRISDLQEDRPWLLNVGTLWTAFSWVLKYFITGPFDALLAHINYRVARSASSVPYQTLFYEKAAEKGEELDEFIMYHEVVINMARFFFLAASAMLLYFLPAIELRMLFLAIAVITLGFMCIEKIPSLRSLLSS